MIKCISRFLSNALFFLFVVLQCDCPQFYNWEISRDILEVSAHKPIKKTKELPFALKL